MARGKHSHELRHYTALYGVSLRTIARWSAKGYPLDDPEATRLLAKGQASAPAGVMASRSGQNDALGLSASIKRLQESEAAAHRDYLQALSKQDELLAGARLRTWTTLAEQLRKTELSNPEVAEANKTTIAAGEVKGVLTELFSKLRQDLETLPKRVALELVSKDEIEIRQVLAREAGEIIQALYNVSYLSEDGEGE